MASRDNKSQMSMGSGGSDSTQRRKTIQQDTRQARAMNILNEVFKKTKPTAEEIDELK